MASPLFADDVILLAHQAVTRLWPSANTGASCSRVWRGYDETQHLQVWRIGSQPEWRSIWGLCWWMWWGWSRRLTGGFSVTSTVMQCFVLDCCGGEGTEREGKAFNFPVDISTVTWKWRLGSDLNNKSSDTSGLNTRFTIIFWIGKVKLPVIKGVEPSGNTLDPPLSVLVWVQDKLDGCFHLEILLQGKQMLLPGTPALGKQQNLSTGIYLEMWREPWNCMLYAR